jgi:hypothetical protein
MQRPFGVGWLRFGGCLLAAFASLNFRPAWAQRVLDGTGPGGTVNIFNTDLAVLEAGETRKETHGRLRSSLPCRL